MKKYIITLTLLVSGYLIVLVGQSCHPCRSDSFYLRLRSIQPTLKRITGVERVSYSPKLIVETFQNDSIGIRYDSLGIDIQNELISINENTSHGISNLYACKPAEKYDNLQKVIITSSEDYTTGYPKGSNLTEIMLVREGFNADGQKIEPYMLNRSLYFGNYFFTFQTPPSEDKFHDITIKYILTNGREYFSTIENVLIRK